MSAPAEVERSMPQAPEAEQVVLGAMMLARDVVPEVCEVVGQEDFFTRRHGDVFAAITALHERGEPTDPPAVGMELMRHGTFERAGRIEYLHTLVAAVPSTMSATWYARQVAQASGMRRIIAAGARLSQIGYDPTHELNDALDLADKIVRELSVKRGDGNAVMWRDILNEGFDALERAADQQDPPGLPTSLSDYNRLTGGLKPGLIVVAARSGVGKSVYLLDRARDVSFRLGLPSLTYTMEMTRLELFNRAMAAEASVPLSAMRENRLDEHDWTRLARAAGETANAPLIVDDSAHVTMADIRAGAHRVHQRHGLSLLVVDYLGLVETTQVRGENRQQAVSQLARSLKLLSKELMVPVIAAAQLNRGADQRTDKRPQKSDLRESGDIENHANEVILLHREDYLDRDSPRKGEIDVDLAKNRHGPTDVLIAAAQMHFSRITEMTVV